MKMRLYSLLFLSLGATSFAATSRWTISLQHALPLSGGHRSLIGAAPRLTEGGRRGMGWGRALPDFMS